MNPSDVSSAEAADIVLRERQRQREAEKRKQTGKHPDKTNTSEPLLETVSVPKWEGADEGEVDESELDRRQRALSEKLEKKQLEVQQQGKKLAKVRAELKALEEPIKAEIMQLRESLEQSNRREISLVTSVNSLRKDLFEKEKALKEVRKEKQDMADGLIRVMADYERRKTERLNEIAELVGAEAPNTRPPKAPNFVGF